jgi:ADP-ribose pyrophosphatase YjhB (NUDIX family)
MSYKLILISIIHRKNKSKLLLVKRNREPGYDKWSLPGGTGELKKEPDPMRAICKEVFSDFDTNMVNPKLFRLKYTTTPEPTLCLYFHGELDGEPKIKCAKTIKEIKWVTQKEVLQTELAFENLDKEVIKQFREEFLKF